MLRIEEAKPNEDTERLVRVGGRGRRNAGRSRERECPKAAESDANKEHGGNRELPEKFHRRRGSSVGGGGGDLNRQGLG